MTKKLFDKSDKLFALQKLLIGTLLLVSISVYGQTADKLLYDGDLKRNVGKYEEAIYFYSQAIALNPKYTDAYNRRGVCKQNLKDYKGAIADYDEAIKLNSKYIKSYLNRAQCKFKLGDKEGACLDWTEAEKLAPYESNESFGRQAKNSISKNCK